MGQGWWLEVGRVGLGLEVGRVRVGGYGWVRAGGEGGGMGQGWWLEVGRVVSGGGLAGRWGGLGLAARGGSGQEGRAKITKFQGLSSASEASLAHWR